MQRNASDTENQRRLTARQSFTEEPTKNFEPRSAPSLELPDPEDTNAWQTYIQELQVIMATRVHAEVARLRGLGIIDDHGYLLITTLPPDMAPDAETSINTG